MPSPFFRELFPFNKEALPFRCQALARLDGHHLEVHFHLSGDLSAIILPPCSTSPRRCNGLWEHTCFEIFLNPEGQDTYWEINFSPSGDWAVYQFTNYRTGMIVEKQIKNVTVSFTEESAQSQKWLATLNLPGIVEMKYPLTCGLSCVIETHDGQKTYWALSHPGAKPDFHNKESFKESLCS